MKTNKLIQDLNTTSEISILPDRIRTLCKDSAEHMAYLNRRLVFTQARVKALLEEAKENK